MGADEELVQFFEKARKAAEKASLENAGESEEVRCLEAIKMMHTVPITTSLLISTQVGKRLRQLTKHSRPKIQKAASNLLEEWKKLVASEAKNGCRGVSEAESSKSQTAMKMERIEKIALVKVESKVKEEMHRSEMVKVESKVKIESFKAETTKPVSTLAPVKLSNIPKTNESTRDKIRELLVEALAKVSSEADEDDIINVRSCDPVRVGVMVETFMFETLGLSKGQNKLKYRSIMFNMRDSNNPDLRRRVLLGEIKPDRLINMSPEEMASDQRKMENQQIKDKALFECERGVNNAASTDQFKCGKCHQRKCTYYQMQTRSADEPMTTFVTCTNCNNRWKFC